MVRSLIKISAALALGSFACAGHALAVSPLPLGGGTSLVLPIQDEENQEVWRDLRPDITPPKAAVGKEGETPKGSPTEQPKGEQGVEAEQKALEEDGLEPK